MTPFLILLGARTRRRTRTTKTTPRSGTRRDEKRRVKSEEEAHGASKDRQSATTDNALLGDCWLLSAACCTSPSMGSPDRLKILVWIPCVTAPLSIVGSLLTLVTVYRSGMDGKERGTYHRLVAGLAVFDLLQSIALALGPLPIPSDEAVPGASGTLGTCTAQAFFVVLGTGSFAYAAMLMVYFVIMVRSRTRSATSTTRRVEPWMHAVAIGYYLFVSVLGLGWGTVGSPSTYCSYGTYPRGCQDDPKVLCERGSKHAFLFETWLMLVPFLLWNVMLIIGPVIILYTVHIRTKRSSRYQFPRASEATGDSSLVLRQSSLADDSQPRSIRRRSSFSLGSQDRRVHLVAVQCVLYAVCFLNVMIWSSISSFYSLANAEYDVTGKQFWMALLSVTFFPLQGLFLFLIFLRPRYAILRSKVRGSCFKIFVEAIWHPSSYSNSRLGSSTFLGTKTSNDQHRYSIRSQESEVDRESGSIRLPVNASVAARSAAAVSFYGNGRESDVEDVDFDYDEVSIGSKAEPQEGPRTLVPIAEACEDDSG